MFEVTSKREALNGTISWGYQVKQLESHLKNSKLRTHKIIKLTEKTSTIPGWELYWSVHIRYYDWCLSHQKFHVLSTHMTFISCFNDKYEAFEKIGGMIRRNGNGTKKEWKFFKEHR